MATKVSGLTQLLKVETPDDTFYFHKGWVSVKFYGPYVIIGTENLKQTVEIRLDSFQDGAGTPISDEASIGTYIGGLLGPIATGAPGDSVITQQVASYSNLVAGDVIGQLAYVGSAQGTAWLPGGLGGSYYPAGLYLWAGATWVSDRNAIATALNASTKLTNQITVTQSNVATTLGGTIDSTRQYFLDGFIDMGTTQITVPPTGLTILGLSFNVSGLTSSADNYTMFVSESIAIGSGDLLGADYLIEVSGTNSKVYELYDATGFNAFEFQRINYNNCTSLGDIYDYRQGLEGGTGRFGGSPSLTLHGLWRGGFRITTSIVRNLSASMTEPLFKAGTLFQMNSRFLTDINCDLPALAPFCDFITADFPNESTVQFKGVIMTRDGVSNSDDTNLTPNLSASDLACDWDNNIGMNNTFIGGAITNTAEAQTSIVTVNEDYDMAGTWDASDLQHFDSPSPNILRHLGNDPKDFRVSFNFVVEGGQNDTIAIELTKVSGATPTIEFRQTRVINNLQGAGGRDVAYFTGTFNIRMNKNDFVVWGILNLTDASDVTLELDSAWVIEER
tara:strand:- start:25821 stop:27503 length:1683 start_codon:yes stop_codon:yes gene_type:complete